MIEEYTKQIKNILNKIEEEGKDLVNECINYETSGELCVGGMLYHYGKVYKIISKCDNFDEAIQQLEVMRTDGAYDGIYDLIKEVQDNLVKNLKENKNYYDVQLTLRHKLNHEYILNTIMRCC